MAESLAAQMSGLGLKPKEDEGLTCFKVGGEIFRLNAKELSKVPYLEGLASGNFSESQGQSPNEPIIVEKCDQNLLALALTYIKRGRAKILLSALPPIYSPGEMFKFLDFLLISKPMMDSKILGERMKNVRTERDKYGVCSRADRSGARDAAVELFWSYNDMENLDNSEEHRIFNLVQFVVSHPKTFYPKALRENVHKWYKANFHMTPKQEEKLNGFLEECADFIPYSMQGRDDDNSSSGGSEPEYYYDSDYSY